MQVKLAEALLRRKELEAKLLVLKVIQDKNLFEVRVARKNVTENIDDITVAVPKLTLTQFTAEYDWHAKQLRLVDAAIQQANWTTTVDVGDSVMAAYVAPPMPVAPGTNVALGPLPK